jgi:thiol-disulfide isomerase/thioredoxin
MTALDWLGVAVRASLLIAALLFVAMAIRGGTKPLEIGTAAPELHLRSYDGKDFGLETFAGKPVVVNFWGTWCPPCLQELPHFVKAAHEYKDEVAFIGAAVNSPPQDAARIIDRFAIPYPIAQVDGRSSALWNARSLPSTYLLNEKHEVVWSVAGAITKKDLDAAIAKHLHGAG